MIDEIYFTAEHRKADMSKVNRIIVNGKVYLAADELLENIDAFYAGVNAYKTGRGGEIDFMKKDGILAGLSMARFFVERLKGGEQE